MKRMTIRNPDGTVSQPTDLKWAEALERLAAYEDSGLTPGQVRCIMGDALTLNLDDETAQNLAELIESAGPRPIFQSAKFNEPNIEFMFAWIRTDEMLPPVGEPVLIVRHSYNGEPVRVEPATLRPDGRWKAIGHKFTQANVTHWMPMPVPPQEGEICHTS